jgi:hypothetical protein
MRDNPIVEALFYFLLVVIAFICPYMNRFNLQGFFGILCDLSKAVEIVTGIGHFIFGNQMTALIYCGLHIIATGETVLGSHGKVSFRTV